MEKFKSILVIFGTASVVFVNFLAAKGYLGGVSTNYLSDLYPTYLTPAGYAFSIWGLIYLGLILFTVYQAMPSQANNFTRVRGLYLVNCLANCVWLWLWHHQLVVATVGAMFVILASLVAINLALSKQDSLIARVPFGIYFGWITVATLANSAICLAFLGFNVSIMLACSAIAIATICGVFFRLKLPNAAYGLTVTWGIVAIAVNHGGVAAISFFAAIGTIILLIAVITPILRLHEAKK